MQIRARTSEAGLASIFRNNVQLGTIMKHTDRPFALAAAIIEFTPSKIC